MQSEIHGKARSMTRGAGRHASGTFPFLSLPPELLQLVLRVLDSEHLQALLHSSKAMAQQVMQHSSGKLQLKVLCQPGKDWAATRHLLQWAPSKCMKLQVWCPQTTDWNWYEEVVEQDACQDEALNSLLGTCMLPGTDPLPQRRFTCLTQVCLQGLILTQVVPSGLADNCPNVHTLCLEDCLVPTKTSCSNTSSTSDDSAVFSVAANITKLKLVSVALPCLDGLQAEQQQQASAVVEQLRASLPGLQCLDLTNMVDLHSLVNLYQLVSLWGPQLTELHVQTEFKHDLDAAQLQLQQVHKLVMPFVRVNSIKVLQALLELPHLKHLELDDVRNITEDLSSHACSWHYLRLHMRDALDLLSIVNMPLHSLKCPLVLGSEDNAMPVWLQYPITMHKVATLQQARSRLQQYGVKLLAKEVAYVPIPDQDVSDVEAADAQHAAVLSAIGTLFASTESVFFDGGTTVGRQSLQALGATHKEKLRSLEMCTSPAQFLEEATWGVLLSSLPGLKKLNFGFSFVEQDCIVGCCRNLATAMAQQGAGRSLDMCFSVQASCGLGLTMAVMDYAQLSPATVILITDIQDGVLVATCKHPH